jgi:hypothetical protein
MSDENFDKETAEAVRVFTFVAASVFALLVAMFLWGVGHRALEEYDHWSCARTCGDIGIAKIGGYADCECQSREARQQVEDADRLSEARRLLDRTLEAMRKESP